MRSGRARRGPGAPPSNFLTRVVVAGDRVLDGLEGLLSRSLRVDASVDGRATEMDRRGLEVVLYAVHTRDGKVAGTYRSRPFMVTPTTPGARTSSRFINVDYGDFFVSLSRGIPGSGWRVETFRTLPAESLERDPSAALGDRRLPSLLIVAMPTDPRLRRQAMVEPLALWAVR